MDSFRQGQATSGTVYPSSWFCLLFFTGAHRRVLLEAVCSCRRMSYLLFSVPEEVCCNDHTFPYVAPAAIVWPTLTLVSSFAFPCQCAGTVSTNKMSYCRYKCQDQAYKTLLGSNLLVRGVAALASVAHQAVSKVTKQLLSFSWLTHPHRMSLRRI